MQFFYLLAKPILFLLPPETAHKLTLRLLNWIGRLRSWITHSLQAVGSREAATPFSPKNRVGLAPGLIKDPRDLPAAVALGAEFVEVGTLTRLRQKGNPRPRLFRLPDDRALINRMGFNNPGFHRALHALRRRYNLPVGINLGKGKRTPDAYVEAELREGVHLFTRVADFFVINLSSPNTPGLRALLDPELLEGMLHRLFEARVRAGRYWSVEPPPLYLKLHPDLEAQERDEILKWLPQAALDGVIVTNTTTQRPVTMKTNPHEVADCGAGGLSGPPLRSLQQELLSMVRRQVPELPIIAVGGIETLEDLQASLKAGADGAEVYTTVIYHGPARLRALARHAKQIAA